MQRRLFLSLWMLLFAPSLKAATPKKPTPAQTEGPFYPVVAGEEASRLGQLRGGFEIGGKIKEETTSYKGNHFVEAFVVKDEVLLARSGKLVVPIN
jgi:hypothetical protein